MFSDLPMVLCLPVNNFEISKYRLVQRYPRVKEPELTVINLESTSFSTAHT